MAWTSPDFKPGAALESQFEKDGFVKLEGFLADRALQVLRERAEAELSTSTPTFTEEFSRLKYDFNLPREDIFSLIGDRSFRHVLCGLAGRSLFFTFEICFELERNVSKGFPWHVGVQSFGYQNARDYGCSMWIPLQSIEPSGQGGGLACVPRSVVSGEFLYEFVEPAIVSTLERKSAAGDTVTLDDYANLRTGILNSPAMNEILTQHAVEYALSPGDVLLFDKYVIHRSVPLGDGPLDRRIAYVLRFIDVESRYDRRRALNLEYPTRELGGSPLTSSHLLIGNEDGEPIAGSSFFDRHDLRTLRLPRA